jgi:hypothetical protein
MVKGRTIASTTLGIVGIWYVYACTHPTINDNAIVYLFDSNLSFEAQNTITTVYKYSLRENVSIDTIHEKLLERYSFLRAITARSTWNGKMIINFLQYTPCAVINTEEVLLSKGIVCPKEIFTISCTASLPQIQISNRTNLYNCSQWIHQCDHTLFQNFLITWYASHTIILQDTHNHGLRFVCSQEQIPNQTLYTYCAQLQADDNCVFDIRFKNNIIMRKIPKGGQV